MEPCVLRPSVSNESIEIARAGPTQLRTTGLRLNLYWMEFLLHEFGNTYGHFALDAPVLGLFSSSWQIIEFQKLMNSKGENC